MMREALRHPLRFAGDHRFTRAQASNYLDDELDGHDRERVDQHTHMCPPCMRLLAGLRRTVSALNALRDAESPRSPGDRGVSEGVLARLREEPDATGDGSDDDGG